jgi:hypothetical protein
MVNKVKPIYFKELAEYDKFDILEKLENNEIILDKLLNHPIVKSNKGIYKFQYVGIIVIDDVVIKCYPKYIPNEENIDDDFKEIINVIKKYNHSRDDFGYDNLDFDDNLYNRLSLMLYFIEDYYENGIYTSFEESLEINGNGEINWNRTINDNLPLIQKNRPYYIELQTKRNINNIFDYFRLLHEFVITECSKFFEKHELLDLFDLTSVELSDKSQNNFGDIDFILTKLDKQLNVEFNTRKRTLLKLMHDYFESKNVFSEGNFLTLYGTPKYEHIWEEMCACVFNNKLDEEVGVTLSELFNKDFTSKVKFKHIVKKPIWILDEGFFEESTFRLDILTLYKHENCVDFIIMDAKYYLLDFENGELIGQPGLESITKQYLYQLAFKKFIEDYKFNNVKNVFLFPTYGCKIENKGCVHLEILSNLDLEDIQVILLPAKEVNQLYLNDGELDISQLELYDNDKDNE